LVTKEELAELFMPLFQDTGFSGVLLPYGYETRDKKYDFFGKNQKIMS